MTDVLFAPDWRSGVPYQQLLADALAAHDVRVSFLANYKRGLPLARLVADWRRTHRTDVLHLHWPEAYFPAKRDGLDWFRAARFSTDLAFATRRCPLVVTAHNLHAHNRGDELFAHHNMRSAFRRAMNVIAHSAGAKARLIEAYGLRAERIHVIPHGDLSVCMPTPVPRAEARAQLGLGEGRLALMFGTVEPYKGQEEVLEFWQQAQPDVQLAIIGRPNTEAYGAMIESTARAAGNVVCRLGWLSDDDLAAWLSAADAVIFNYRTVFTSGAASLARSWGLPLLLPARLETVALDEPSPRVFRFENLHGDFAAKLRGALAVAPDFASAADWRGATSWDRVAALTVRAYRGEAA
jgi:glycosyltransferase involved in cell wall biosynthesis